MKLAYISIILFVAFGLLNCIEFYIDGVKVDEGLAEHNCQVKCDKDMKCDVICNQIEGFGKLNLVFIL